jgi:putative hemolysin
MWGVELIVMIAMIAINSVFTGYEIALASIGIGRLRRLAQDGRRGARVALHMKENMEASLAVVRLGITLVGATAAAVGGAGAEGSVSPTVEAAFGLSPRAAEVAAIALVVAPLTIVTILAGELIPKDFALRNAERVTLALSPAMRWFSLSVWPLVHLLETVVTSAMSWAPLDMRTRASPSSSAREILSPRSAT